jgi:hypothetical protein
MTLQLLHSEFPYIRGKFDFLFLSVRKGLNGRKNDRAEGGKREGAEGSGARGKRTSRMRSRKYEGMGTMTCVGNGVELLIQEGERDDDGVGEDDGDEKD